MLKHRTDIFSNSLKLEICGLTLTNSNKFTVANSKHSEEATTDLTNVLSLQLKCMHACEPQLHKKRKFNVTGNRSPKQVRQLRSSKQKIK